MLKTHSIFNVIRAAFEANLQIVNGSLSDLDKTKKLMTKMVNSLVVKSEIGAPMAVMYLLGNPDHYTNVSFKSFHWQAFVSDWQSWPASSATPSSYILGGIKYKQPRIHVY